MKRFAMILSGCGGMDGTEIHEAVSLMIAIRQAGCEYKCFALDKDQKYVIQGSNHIHSEEKRNMLVEGSRLNHGMIFDLQKLNVSQFDALILPGGYGTGTSLSNFITCDNTTCTKNSDYEVIPEIKAIIQEFYSQQKPICAGCMAPILVNGSLTGITIMIDEGLYTKDAIEKKGNYYKITKAGELCVDEEHKIVTMPFYMSNGVKIETIFDESVKAISKTIELCNK